MSEEAGRKQASPGDLEEAQTKSGRHRWRDHRPSFCGHRPPGPLIAPYPPDEGELTKRLNPPSREHLLGTDALGRDLLSRVIYGARISLQIQVVSVAIALIIGTLLGMVGGYYGGKFDHLIMRLMDILLAFPGIFLAIAIIAVLGPGLVNLDAGSGDLLHSAIRADRPGIGPHFKGKGVRRGGQGRGGEAISTFFSGICCRTPWRPIIVQTTLRMATVLLTASGLSFLGLGVQPPTAEWGAMLSNARAYLITAPHVATVPGLAIMLVVMGFNLFGDGLEGFPGSEAERLNQMRLHST